MLRVQRPASGESEQDVNSAAREDLIKLRRQYRVRDVSRKQYHEQADNALKKQQDMIDALKAENADLMKNLHVTESKHSEDRDKLLVSKLEDLIQKQMQYKHSISEGEKEVGELEKTIKEMEVKLDKQRQKLGSALLHKADEAHIRKQFRVKENRLEKALIRFNSSLASSSDLRYTIDHLRKERHVFEEKYKKLQKELVDIKKTMGRVIEVSTQAYEIRDDAQNKMMALKEKAEKELAHYNMELKELIRVIEHDRKLKEFMSRKDQERTEAHEEMEAMKRKKEFEKSSEREKTVMSYEQAFEQIKEATGITDIDQLVNKFIEVEDQNFALFNYVNELNGSIESLQEQIQQIHADIEQFKSQGVEMEQRRMDILKGLEKELDSVKEETAVTDSRYAAATKVLDQLKSGIESVFSKIGCDSSAITDMLGGHAGVTDNTVLQYLGIVEQRTNELLQLQAFIQAKESDDSEAMKRFLMGLGPINTQASTTFILPSASDELESDTEADEEGKPMTTDELRARAVKGLSRREVKKVAITPGGSKNMQLSGPTTAPSRTRGNTTDKKKRSITTR